MMMFDELPVVVGKWKARRFRQGVAIENDMSLFEIFDHIDEEIALYLTAFVHENESQCRSDFVRMLEISETEDML